MFLDQDKLDVVKQEMAKVNINILGISKIKWMRMGKFNSKDHYIYYYGQEPLKRNGVEPHSQQRSPSMQYLVSISKTTDLSLFVSKANYSTSQ